jgi:hypothetical protein
MIFLRFLNAGSPAAENRRNARTFDQMDLAIAVRSMKSERSNISIVSLKNELRLPRSKDPAKACRKHTLLRQQAAVGESL